MLLIFKKIIGPNMESCGKASHVPQFGPPVIIIYLLFSVNKIGLN